MKAWIAAAVVVAGAIASAGCSRSQATERPPDTTVEAPKAPNVFELENADRFQLVTAESRRLHDDLIVNGVVSPDVSRTVPVNSMSAGRVLDVRARLGDDVRKGDLLLRLQSPDLAQAISDYHKAIADEALAKRALDRAQLLFDHGALAQKDLESAQNAEAKASVDVGTAAEKIRILGGSTDNPTPILEVRAPASGTIVDQQVANGAGVKSLDNSPNLFTIADLSKVWLLCDVYENNLSQVAVGDFAEVRLAAYPDKVLRGRVSNIGKILDPSTRTAKVRLELENPRGLLRPGMFATAKFVSGDTSSRVILPTTAILRLHDKDWVFLPVADKSFQRTEVRAGAVLPGGAQEILAGIRPGERVVASALQLASAVENQ